MLLHFTSYLTSSRAENRKNVLMLFILIGGAISPGVLPWSRLANGFSPPCHEELDRVPIDLGSHASSTIAVLAYMKLRAHLKLDQHELPKMYNTWGQYCDVQDEILDHLGCDVIPLHRCVSSFSIHNDGEWKEWTLVDGSKCLVPAEFTPKRKSDGDWEWYENGEMIVRDAGRRAPRFHPVLVAHAG